jgi:hypothetical protein
MVLELVQRGVLKGDRVGYVCRVDVADVAVPATVQAAIEARIDSLNSAAKRTVNAASVIGVALRRAASDRAGHRSGVRRTAGGGADRSGAVELLDVRGDTASSNSSPRS